MPTLKVLGFDGLEPRTSPTMLGEAQAQVADNVKLYSQELRTWRGPTQVVTTAIQPLTIYKLLGSSTPLWLSFVTDVDIVPGPLADVTEHRIYLTGAMANTPQKTNYALASVGTYYPMGVPAPTAAPAVATAGGSGTAESRAYVYTYLATFGAITEESAPSPASAIITVLTGGSVTVNSFTAPPAGYNITGRRIYRTVTGTDTDSYEFVAEIPLSTLTYSDTLAFLQLGEVIPTIGWIPPPDGLVGLVALPGGYLAGFVGNTVYFSQPYQPHAWPLAYAISLAYHIVGLAAFGSSLAVLTTSFPYVINGSAPGALTAEKLPMDEACVSKTSIASDVDGVIYASPNGLIGIGSAQLGNITPSLFTRDEWATFFPALMRGAIYSGRYFGIFPDLSNGKAIVLSRTDKPALSRLDLNATAVRIEDTTGNLYYADATDGDIYLADSDDVRPLSYVWRSKRTVFPKATSFSAVRIDADYAELGDATVYNAQVAAALAANALLWASPLNGAVDTTALNVYDVNGSALQNVPHAASARSVQLLIYGDGALICTLDFTSFDPVRLPAFRSQAIEFELTGNINVRSITFGTTVAELFA